MATDVPPALVDFVVGAPTSSGSLDVRWNHGVRPRSGDTEPTLQVHRFDEHTFILRQSKTVSYEAPFLYLLFGNARAVLFDTGATDDPARCPVRETVDALVTSWLVAHPRTSYGLVVAHTHGHRDHVAGDGQFTGGPGITVVGADRPSVIDFFGFPSGPTRSSGSTSVGGSWRSPGFRAITTARSRSLTRGPASC